MEATFQNEDNYVEILQQDVRYKHYLKNLDRIVLRDDIVTRQFHDGTGQIKFHQILPKNLLEAFLQALQGTPHNHPGIFKVLQELRQKFTTRE